MILLHYKIHPRARFDSEELEVRRLAFSLFSERYSSEQRRSIEARVARLLARFLSISARGVGESCCARMSIECNWAEIAWVNKSRVHEDESRTGHAGGSVTRYCKRRCAISIFRARSFFLGEETIFGISFKLMYIPE